MNVNWGDGSPDTVFTTLNQGNLGTQNHTYTTANSYTIHINVSDAYGNFGQMASNNFTVNPPLVPTTIITVAGTPQSATVGTQFITNLAAQVLDQNHNPVAGVTVLFVAPGSGASGTFLNGLTSIAETTTAGGVATAPFTANTKAGVYTVNASVSGVATPAPFDLTNTADVDQRKIVDRQRRQSIGPDRQSNRPHRPGNGQVRQSVLRRSGKLERRLRRRQCFPKHQ